MIYDKVITGRYVRIYSISEKDADFSLEIRQNKQKNKFLHQVDNNRDKQLKWIENQRKRAGDYFFIVETLKGNKVGTVGVYDIKGGIGHLGRLLMVGNPFCSFEGMMLAMDFAYNELNLSKLFGDVHVDNIPSMNISEAFGFHFDSPVYDEELDRYFRYGTSYKVEYSTYRDNVTRLIYR